MNEIYVVTEGELDAELLSKLVPDDLSQSVKWLSGGSGYGAKTLAASIIARRQRPTVLILNSDNRSKDEVVDFAHDMLGRVAGETPFRVIAAEPEIEAVFLQSRAFIEKVAQRKFSDLEWRMAQAGPKRFLREILGDNAVRDLLNTLDARYVETLRMHPFVVSLLQFLAFTVTENT